MSIYRNSFCPGCVLTGNEPICDTCRTGEHKVEKKQDDPTDAVKTEEKPYRLDDKHLEEAKRITEASVIKPGCKLCYGRGWIGVNPKNELITCTKCVDTKKINFVWYCYLETLNDPILNERYKTFIEDVKKAEAENKN